MLKIVKDKLQVIMKIDSFIGLQLPDSPLILARFEGECWGHANFNITKASSDNYYVTYTRVTMRNQYKNSQKINRVKL